ncbi:MAG: LuxR C-terminal-related transcriptional regulator [Armatimonadota bacterium]|nr:LuxR C-terminal-related transcriptional regulator [Armatimonadota bacterium]
MDARELSQREEEVVDLCIEGLTNEAIAGRMGVSVTTVKTYWLRIKFKVGGLGKTDTVIKVLKERSRRGANVQSDEQPETVAEKGRVIVQYRAALALLQLAMDQIRRTVWVTDKELSLQIIANSEDPSAHFGVPWEVGKTVYEIFKTDDPAHSAVAAHLAALDGGSPTFD